MPTMSAEALNCPMCGALVASLDATGCDHCGARLATVACPSCFGMIFQGAKFCSHCGAKVERTEVAEATKELCPHCKIGLEAVQVGTASLRECSKCGGIWVNKSLFEQICLEHEEQSAVLGMAFSLPDNPVETADLKVRYYPCPTCKSLMNRVNFAHCSGVIVDVCHDHGTWFDQDELRRIVEFIRAGGLDKARSYEIEDLKRQQQQLKSIQTVGSTIGDSWNRPVSTPWLSGRNDLVGWGITAALVALRLLFK